MRILTYMYLTRDMTWKTFAPAIRPALLYEAVLLMLLLNTSNSNNNINNINTIGTIRSTSSPNTNIRV